jgi:hypothetical protein
MSRAELAQFRALLEGDQFWTLRGPYVPEKWAPDCTKGNPKLRLLSRAQDASNLAQDYTATAQAADRSLTSENRSRDYFLLKNIPLY